MPKQTNANATIEAVFQPVLSALARLVRREDHDADASCDVEQIEALLGTLPLSSDEFGIACNRLSNARRYLLANEVGAARWELNALASQLRSRADAKTREPRRRRRR